MTWIERARARVRCAADPATVSFGRPTTWRGFLWAAVAGAFTGQVTGEAALIELVRAGERVLAAQRKESAASAGMEPVARICVLRYLRARGAAL